MEDGVLNLPFIKWLAAQIEAAIWEFFWSNQGSWQHAKLSLRGKTPSLVLNMTEDFTLAFAGSVSMWKTARIIPIGSVFGIPLYLSHPPGPFGDVWVPAWGVKAVDKSPTMDIAYHNVTVAFTSSGKLVQSSLSL